MPIDCNVGRTFRREDLRLRRRRQGLVFFLTGPFSVSRAAKQAVKRDAVIAIDAKAIRRAAAASSIGR